MKNLLIQALGLAVEAPQIDPGRPIHHGQRLKGNLCATKAGRPGTVAQDKRRAAKKRNRK